MASVNCTSSSNDARLAAGQVWLSGLFAAIPTMGVSAIGAGIGAVRVHNNKKRVSIIEERLREEGWKGHKTGLKDYALPVTIGVVGAAVSVGIDAAFDASGSGGRGGGGGDGVTPSGAEASAGDATVPTGEPQVAAPTGNEGVEQVNACPDQPRDGVPPAQHIPFASTVQTPENGIGLAFDGVPVAPDYGQITDSGMYMLPTDGVGNFLAAGAPPDVGQWGTTGQGGMYGGTACEPQPYQFGQPQLDQFGQPQPDQFGQSPPIGSDMPQPPSISEQVANTYSPTALGWDNAVAGAGAAAAAHAGAHSHHVFTGMMYAGADEATTAVSKQAAKLAVKSIWKALESGSSLPTYGEGSGQIRPTSEFFAEYNRVTQTKAWKELIVYVEHRERQKRAMKYEVRPDASSIWSRD